MGARCAAARRWPAPMRARLADAAAGAHARQGEYIYTLEPGPTAATPSTSSGSTASWASASTSPAAFVVVMRAMDVPARIVTGYQGTDPQPVDGYYVVRQSHAHAWAEYWQPGDGWVRVDPTAAVAPDRIRVQPQPATPRGLVAGAGQRQPRLALQLRQPGKR
jgi:hypothetical protein